MMTPVFAPIRHLLLAATLGLALSGPVMAGTEQVIRLSPEQKADALDAGSQAKADASMAQALGGGGSLEIHGEVGAMIGTGGARSVFGTAVMPLGESGVAAFSFENSRYGRLR